MSERPEPASSVAPGAITALLLQVARAPSAAAAELPTFHPGQVIGRFELVREIGRGGFGVVYEARDRQLGRSVAFKALRAGGAPDVPDGLLREAEAAARLSHPNLVTLHDVGHCEHGPYLVMELLRGRTLLDELGDGALPLGEAIRIAIEVAKGVAHAHAHGVVHRDLTPGNVFLCDDGRVKVLDFGMAHAFGRRRIEGGTRAYMAPEQRRGAPEDERADVFALGVILHQMIRGALPLAEDRARGGDDAPRIDAALPPALGEVLARMLAADPVDRPRDGDAVVAALVACESSSSSRRAASPAVPRHAARRGTPPPPFAAAGRRRTRPRLIAVAALAVVSTSAALAWRLLPRPDAMPEGRVTSATESLVPSIAVLPFTNLSADPEQEYFSDGLSEEILNALAHVEALRVVGRTSSFSFKGKNEDLRVIGQKLGVRNVLEGTVRSAGKRLRISANLVDVSSGYQLWAETYERDATEVFAVQEEIAGAVVRALEVKLLPGQAPSAGEHRTSNPEAYRQYLIGQHLFYRGTDDSARLGARAFERAIAADPDYAPPYAGLAMTLVDLEHLSDDAVERAGMRRRAFAAAERAVSLAPDLAEASSARGLLRSYWARDWAGARADLERAVRLSPGSAQAHRRLAIFLAGQGQLAEAVASARRATDLDPLAGVNWRWLAHFQAADGRMDLARRSIDRALELLPESEYAHAELATFAIVDGNPAEALSHSRHLNERDRLLITALAEHDLGHPADARRALDELVPRIGAVDAQAIASIYAWWGDRDRAFEWLGRAVREDQVVAFLGFDPFLRALHDDPRWTALLRDVGLAPEHAKR